MNSKRKEKLIRRWSLLIVVMMALIWLGHPYIAIGLVIGLILSTLEIEIINKEKEVILKISCSQVVDWLIAR